MSAEDFISFWKCMDLSFGPYVHPQDKLKVEQRYKVIELNTLDEVRQSIEDDRWNSNRLHTRLLPQPYKGDLRKADIFILLTNPGASPADYFAQHSFAAFREAIVGQTTQSNKEFTGLNPNWYWTATFQWWRPKFEKIAIEMVQKSWAPSVADALRQIRERIAVVEYIPYPSKRSPAKHPLASSNQAKKFVHSLPESKSLMIMRSANLWDVPDTRKNVFKSPPEQCRNVSFNPENNAGAFLLNHFDPQFTAKN